MCARRRVRWGEARLRFYLYKYINRGGVASCFIPSSSHIVKTSTGTGSFYISFDSHSYLYPLCHYSFKHFICCVLCSDRMAPLLPFQTRRTTSTCSEDPRPSSSNGLGLKRKREGTCDDDHQPSSSGGLASQCVKKKRSGPSLQDLVQEPFSVRVGDT